MVEKSCAMNKTKIEWADYTWNPIKGLCPVGCWYCYARKTYKRFGEQIMGDYEDEEGGSSLDINTPFLADPEAEKFPKKASRIFVCSTFELFHPIADQWRDDIFKVIEFHPEHTFFILTKLPQNIDCPMPENVWLGVSVETTMDMWRLAQIKKYPKSFVSFEPLMGPISMPEFVVSLDWIKWVIVGRLTGYGKMRDPELDWIKYVAGTAEGQNVPVFLKNNLSGIWPGKLIQEYPKEWISQNQHHPKS